MNDPTHGGVTAAQGLGGHTPRQAMALGTATSTNASDIDTSHLVEVWGDTVDSRHLAWSVVLGVGISLGAFLIANRIFALFVHDAAMSRAYSMLVGLLACIVAGAVCARLFKPKRRVVEETADGARLQSVLDELAAEPGGLGTVADLPPAVVAEMKELGLYDLFADAERRASLAASQPAIVSDVPGISGAPGVAGIALSPTVPPVSGSKPDLARGKELV